LTPTANVGPKHAHLKGCMHAKKADVAQVGLRPVEFGSGRENALYGIV
jgi:hypothetical protein